MKHKLSESGNAAATPQTPLSAANDPINNQDCPRAPLSAIRSGVSNLLQKLAVSGVCSREYIPRGTRFGPLVGEVYTPESVPKDANRKYFWRIYEDGELHHFVDGLDESRSNWMRYVNPAHSEADQNVSACQNGLDVYFYTTRAVEAGAELLVWYCREYAQRLHYPASGEAMMNKLKQSLLEVKQQQATEQRLSPPTSAPVTHTAHAHGSPAHASPTHTSPARPRREHSVLSILRGTSSSKREPSRPLPTRPLYPTPLHPDDFFKSSQMPSRSPGNHSSTTPSPSARSSPESSPHGSPSSGPFYPSALPPFPGYSPPSAAAVPFYPASSSPYSRYILPQSYPLPGGGVPTIGGLFPRMYPLYNSLLPPLLPSDAGARRFLPLDALHHRDFLLPGPTSAFSAATALKDKATHLSYHVAPPGGSPTAGTAPPSERVATKPTAAMLASPGGSSSCTDSDEQDLRTALQPKGASARAQRREAVQVSDVQQRLHAAGPPAETLPRPHGREAARVSGVSQALQQHQQPENPPSASLGRETLPLQTLPGQVHPVRPPEAAQAPALPRAPAQMPHCHRHYIHLCSLRLHLKGYCMASSSAPCLTVEQLHRANDEIERFDLSEHAERLDTLQGGAELEAVLEKQVLGLPWRDFNHHAAGYAPYEPTNETSVIKMRHGGSSLPVTVKQEAEV
ncbi:hypothetical protein WMY93_030587 [Mugilogobius chulae]|uniref:PR domain zinc finger protein 1 n=1 Tax=Mugilogobius chulae TaxID=88201 RepID=A0AAW0MMP2_9GOBI